MRVVYFAWLRERIGKPEEEIAFPTDVRSVSDALAYLAGRGEEYAYAFERPEIIRAAIDKRHAPNTAEIAGASELAFFPPMTGG